MSQRITESAVEEFCLEVLETQGYRFVSPEELDRKEPSIVIRPPLTPACGPFRRLDEALHPSLTTHLAQGAKGIHADLGAVRGLPVYLDPIFS